MAAQQEALQGEVLSEVLVTDNEEVKAQYPDDIDDTGMEGRHHSLRFRRGVVAHDPQDERKRSALSVMRRPRCCRCMKCYWRGPPVKKQRSWKRRPRTCTMLFASPNLTRIMATLNKATLQQIRNGDAPPVWSVNDARHRSDLEWIAHVHEGLCV